MRDIKGFLDQIYDIKSASSGWHEARHFMGGGLCGRSTIPKSFRISENLRADLRAISDYTGLSESEIIRNAVEAYIYKQYNSMPLGQE